MFGPTRSGSELTFDVQATKLMGLPITAAESWTAAKRFSRDVLKLEIVGPNQPHLSVVDVPGKRFLGHETMRTNSNGALQGLYHSESTPTGGSSLH